MTVVRFWFWFFSTEKILFHRQTTSGKQILTISLPPQHSLKLQLTQNLKRISRALCCMVELTTSNNCLHFLFINPEVRHQESQASSVGHLSPPLPYSVMGGAAPADGCLRPHLVTLACALARQEQSELLKMLTAELRLLQCAYWNLSCVLRDDRKSFLSRAAGEKNYLDTAH